MAANAVVVGVAPPAEMISVSGADVDAAKPELPEKMAVIECEPAVRLLLLTVAIPEEFKFAKPIGVAPSKKVTVPSGDPVGVGETVAVKTIDWPAVPGFGFPVSTVVVEAGGSAEVTSVTGEEVEVANPLFPE